MILTKAKEKELDAVKKHIEHLETLAFNAKVKSQLALDIKDFDECEKQGDLIDEIENMISKSIVIQAETMNISPDLCSDLIFDEELRKKFK